MAATVTLRGSEHLPRLPLSGIDRPDWHGVTKVLDEQGQVAITSGGRPLAVVLSVDRYEAIRQALRKSATARDALLEALRRRFDERLAPLQAPDAGDRLRALMHRPARLGGKVRAGAG